MGKTQLISASKIDTGEAAIDGIAGGLLAGLVMLIVLLVGGLALGETPAAVLGRFDLSGRLDPLVGALAHVSVSSVYGVVYGLCWALWKRRIRPQPPAWLAGCVYGLGLFLIAEYFLLVGRSPSLLQIPAALFLCAHLIYGLVLGISTEGLLRRA